MSDDSIVDLIQQHQGNPPESNRPKPEDPSIKQKTESMSQALPPDKGIEGALEKLLTNVKSKMAWIEVELPSQGLLYESGCSKVKIRPFTFEDERTLKTIDNQGSNAEGVLERLIDVCVEGISAGELTPLDRLYILFRLRGISYGDSYAITHDCENCSARSELNLEISTLETTKLEASHMTFTLPDSEQEVEIKLPRVQDEHLYNNSETLLNNLHLFIRRIGDVRDSVVLEEFVRRTTVRDIDILRRKIFIPEYGMENHFFYTCKGCSTKNRVEIGLNENFFTGS